MRIVNHFPSRWFCSMLLFALLFSACKNSDKHPDVSDIKVEIESRRLDKDLYQLDTNHLAASLTQLREKYPDFLDFYLDTLLAFGIHGNYNDTVAAIKDGVHSFVSEKDYRDLADTIAVHFPDVKKQDEDLKKSFQYFKYYFPDITIPKVVYFSSGLNNWGAVTIDNIQGIGLDMYLGEAYKYYPSVGLAPYLYSKFTPEFIPVAVMSNQYELMAPFHFEEKTLLDLMIQKGKLYYFLSKTVPFVAEHKRMGYTEDQLAWCAENERAIYTFFVQQKLLYNANLQTIMRYVLDGPTSSGIANSPGNVGSWLGYKIVQKYMDKHPNLQLKDLLQPIPAEQFLRESGYKP